MDTGNKTLRYRIDVCKGLWKYAVYLLPIIDMVDWDNFINMKQVKKQLNISHNQYNRLISIYKKLGILKKSWLLFYMNPLIAFLGNELDPYLSKLFEEELNKVWINI